MGKKFDTVGTLICCPNRSRRASLGRVEEEDAAAVEEAPTVTMLDFYFVLDTDHSMSNRSRFEVERDVEIRFTTYICK